MNFAKRRETLLKNIDTGSIVIFYSGNAPIRTANQKYDFAVNKNFYYLTGINQEGVSLVLIKSKNGIKQFIFAQEYDEHTAKWDGTFLSFDKIATIAQIDVKDVLSCTKRESFLAAILSTTRSAVYGVINNVYFDLARLDFSSAATYEERFAHDLGKKYPHLKIQNSAIFLSSLRMFKDEDEIEAIKKSIAISQKAFDHLFKVIPTCKSESAVLAHYMFTLNSNGVAASFHPIVAAGKNACILHYNNNNQPLVKDALILLDLGVECYQYASDITRTLPVSGKFSDRQKQIYQAVLNVNKEVISKLKPGLKLKDFNALGIELLTKEAKKIGLLKDGEDILKYYYHSLGHSLGLDVHDKANYELAFAEGMIITVEPGLYVEEEAIGVRIEDDILITKTGCINLSEGIPKEIVDIENLMKV